MTWTTMIKKGREKEKKKKKKMAEGGKVRSIGGLDSKEKQIEKGHGDPFISSFLKECGALGDSYIKIQVEEDLLPIFSHHQLKTKIFQVQRIGKMCWNGSLRY